MSRQMDLLSKHHYNNSTITIYDNFLDEAAIEQIKEVYDFAFTSEQGYDVKQAAGAGLYKGVDGDVSGRRLSPMDDDLRHMIKDKMVSLLDVKRSQVKVMFHGMGSQGGMQWHTDASMYGAATIFLNDGWAHEYGGLFTFPTEEGFDLCYSVLPIWNRAVIQIGGYPHAVLPSYSHAPLRKSLQVFIHNE